MGAVITGCHVIAKGNHAEAMKIAPEILDKGLLVNHSFYGTAAWAYYVDMVPKSQASKCMVVFDVDERFVFKFVCPLPHISDFAIMKMPGQLFSYIPINVKGFVNLPGFQSFQGNITFV
jgi:hypothetical protein